MLTQQPTWSFLFPRGTRLEPEGWSWQPVVPPSGSYSVLLGAGTLGGSREPRHLGRVRKRSGPAVVGLLDGRSQREKLRQGGAPKDTKLDLQRNSHHSSQCGSHVKGTQPETVCCAAYQLPTAQMLQLWDREQSSMKKRKTFASSNVFASP